MAATDEIVLWKAPQPGRDGSREVVDGFDLTTYPGNGPYFTTVRAIAEAFLASYQSGIQVIYLPRTSFEELLRNGIIVPDPLYAEGESYHVPPAGLAVFNNAIRQGTPNEFHA